MTHSGLESTTEGCLLCSWGRQLGSLKCPLCTQGPTSCFVCSTNCEFKDLVIKWPKSVNNASLRNLRANDSVVLMTDRAGGTYLNVFENSWCACLNNIPCQPLPTLVIMPRNAVLQIACSWMRRNIFLSVWNLLFLQKLIVQQLYVP